MGNLLKKLLLPLCLLASILICHVSASAGPLDAAMGFGVRSGCRGTIGECLENEDSELDLDSVSNRRILATRRYISYGALQRNNVPCSRRGASYYNCRPGAEANPYRRGCSAITRCRS